MPDPTEREVPKGQAPGQAQAQQDFISKQSEPGQNPGPADVAAQGISPSAVAQPQVQQAQPSNFKPPPEQAPPVEVEPNTGINLYDFLHGPTQRPNEDVRQGLPGFESVRKIGDILKPIAQQNNSPDVQAIMQYAQRLGL